MEATMRRWLLLPLLALAGCNNGNGNPSIHLGDVSLGRQLIELKEARDAGAMTPDEYEKVKHALIDAIVKLAKPEGDDAS
jgi:hypothetical protein